MSSATPSPPPSDLLSRIRLIAFDVDGVLTDGRILLTERDEWKSFHVRDGVAIRLAQKAGIQVAFLSGRSSAAVDRRAADLEVRWVTQGSRDKIADFHRILERAGVTIEEAAFVGDDLPDLPLLRRVGLSACPADAAEEVRRDVDYVCRTAGGYGVARELIEYILRRRGEWEGSVRALA